MALTKQQKSELVSEVTSLLSSSKMTVIAKYQGTTVKALQTLRKEAKSNGTKVKVIKNRLVIQALKATEELKDADTTALEGMLLYAFNGEDEVAAAQILNNFAKQNPSIEFVGAFSSDGSFVTAADVKALASLPSKNQLIAGIINTLNAPIQNTLHSLGGNLSAILKGLETKAS